MLVESVVAHSIKYNRPKSYHTLVPFGFHTTVRNPSHNMGICEIYIVP